MLSRWIPWQFLVRRAARRHGFLDPLTLLARLRQFSQPSEVAEPIELLRAGMMFHARGLLNTKAIQNNLDWIWPRWVEEQFDPESTSFIPRAFSFSHINLTHRNWTAVGLPDFPSYPIIDPHGLVTPLFDAWSIDFWVLGPADDGELAWQLTPSKLDDGVIQDLDVSDPERLVLNTAAAIEQAQIVSSARVEPEGGSAVLRIRVKAAAGPPGGRLAVSIRPCNPEGVQLIETIAFDPERRAFVVDGGSAPLELDRAPDEVHFSTYRRGDVFHTLRHPEQKRSDERRIRCPTGLASAAALFNLPADHEPVTVELRMDLSADEDAGTLSGGSRRAVVSEGSWKRVLHGTARLEIPDARTQFLYDSAVRTLLLLSADDVVPGPYTYKRFWFRDACLMLRALLAIGRGDRVRRAIDTFPDRQDLSGYFHSQEGEWDSNGQVLWLIDRFCRDTDSPPDDAWIRAISKAARWIMRKRRSESRDPEAPDAGLLPAGFSAEHFGPNDHYYWDDFWGVAGLEAASRLLRGRGADLADECGRDAVAFMADIDASIDRIPKRRRRDGLSIPASPFRRMDSGAVGSMVADFPLRLTAPHDPRIGATLEFLLAECRHGGGFFQDMIHSGVNAYLTLALAQTCLRRGDPRFRQIISSIADLASPTGHWPEAIHPHTLGGCMGDGQHGWAAADWVMMMRSLFVREEEAENTLVLGSGVDPDWIAGAGRAKFGPTPTPWGDVTVTVEHDRLRVDAAWRGDSPPRIVVAVPGCEAVESSRPQAEFALTPEPPAAGQRPVSPTPVAAR